MIRTYLTVMTFNCFLSSWFLLLQVFKYQQTYCTVQPLKAFDFGTIFILNHNGIVSNVFLQIQTFCGKNIKKIVFNETYISSCLCHQHKFSNSTSFLTLPCTHLTVYNVCSFSDSVRIFAEVGARAFFILVALPLSALYGEIYLRYRWFYSQLL